MKKMAYNDKAVNMRLILAFILITFALHVQAQTVIDGTVLDAQGKAMKAYVTAAAKDSGVMIAYADTDRDGRYRLGIDSNADSLTVTVASLAIGRQAKTVANCSQRLDFNVEQRAIELKEVSVRVQKIRQSGDTLNYLVGAYQQQGDRVIGDMLKRMPGIEVSQSGGIKFNGKSITKFYVEDMDLLQGRYGLATNSINAEDVATVQVIENHQPVKSLQGRTLTDDVAINLKLKDKSKDTMAANVMLGGGGQSSDWQTAIGQNPLWTAEVVGMYFARRRQSMTLYKGNNTGDDVSQELTSHYSSINSVELYPFCPMNAVMPSSSGLAQKRTFDNHSHLATMNLLEKIDKDTELSINVTYHHDHIRQEGASKTDLFISDNGRLLNSGTLTSDTYLNNLSTNLRYCRNAERGFTANVVKFDGGWNSDDVQSQLSSTLTGTQTVNYGYSRIYQHFHRPTLSASNTLNIIRNYGRTPLTSISRQATHSVPTHSRWTWTLFYKEPRHITHKA